MNHAYWNGRITKTDLPEDAVVIAFDYLRSAIKSNSGQLSPIKRSAIRRTTKYLTKTATQIADR